MSPVRIRSPAPIICPPDCHDQPSGSPFRWFLPAFLYGSAQDYKLEPVSTAAPGSAGRFASVIQGQGFRVNGAAGPWCEIWLAKVRAGGAKPDDAAISFGIAQGTLIGVLRFPGKGADRRGQVIPAGVYTLRYSNFPVDGAHSGVAPQRDFALMTPIGADADPAAKPGFDELVKMSGEGFRHAASRGFFLGDSSHRRHCPLGG